MSGYPTGSSGYRRVVLSLFVAGVATFASLYSTQAVLPQLAREFSLSAGESALSVSFATLGLGIALLLVGPLTDMIGRTPVMHTSLAVSSLVGIVTAVVPTWPLLLTCRVVQGAALAGLSSVALAYLKEEIAPAAQARASGLYIGGTALGGMTGRLLSGWVADHLGWRGAVGSVGGLALGCTVATWLLLPASRHFVPMVARPAEVWRGIGRVLSDPVLLACYAVAFLAMGAFVGVYNSLGFRLESPPYGLSLGAASLVFLCYALGSVSSTYAGRLADRYSRRVVVAAALAVMLVGVLITPVAPLGGVVVAVAVLTVGFFGAHGVASGWVAARAGHVGGGAGQAASLYSFFYYLGSSICGTVAAGGWSSGGWARVTVLVAALTVGALAVAVTLWVAVERGRVSRM